MKNFLRRALADDRQVQWAAPLRAARRALGLRPAPRPVALARRILVIRPDEIGDVLLSGPFFRELRKKAPAARITLLVKRECRALVEACPHIDEIVTLPFGSGWGESHTIHLRAEALRLRLERRWYRGFDLVLLPRRDPDWAGAEVVAHLLAGRGAVLAHRESRVQNSGAPPFVPGIVDATYSNPRIEHEVAHNLGFLNWGEPSGDERLELWVSEADRAAAAQMRSEKFTGRGALVVLHPSGGRSPLKQWPRKAFADLWTRLRQETAAEFLVIGGPDETWIRDEFPESTGPRSTTAVGSLSLGQLAAAIAGADLFIGGDSGPLHIAAAAGIRTLGLLGPTSEVRFRPRGEQSRVVSLRFPCSPDQLGTFENRCQKCIYPENRCLTTLPVDAVLTAARSLLPALAANSR